jgi:hypothetical protein
VCSKPDAPISQVGSRKISSQKAPWAGFPSLSCGHDCRRAQRQDSDKTAGAMEDLADAAAAAAAADAETAGGAAMS